MDKIYNELLTKVKKLAGERTVTPLKKQVEEFPKRLSAMFMILAVLYDPDLSGTNKWQTLRGRFLRTYRKELLTLLKSLEEEDKINIPDDQLESFIAIAASWKKKGCVRACSYRKLAIGLKAGFVIPYKESTLCTKLKESIVEDELQKNQPKNR